MSTTEMHESLLQKVDDEKVLLMSTSFIARSDIMRNSLSCFQCRRSVEIRALLGHPKISSDASPWGVHGPPFDSSKAR